MAGPDRRVYLIALAAAAAALGLPACGPDMREKTVPHVDDMTVRRVEGDPFEQMIAVCRIRGFQRLDFERALGRYEAHREEIESGPPGEARAEARQALDRAKAAGDPAAVRAAEGQLETARRRYRKALASQRAEVMEILSLEQQRDWAGYLLYHRALKRFDAVMLGEGQKGAIRRFANELAEEKVEKGTVRKDPFLEVLEDEALVDTIVDRAVERVLNPIQREKMADASS
jgi:hypothetical protein